MRVLPSALRRATDRGIQKTRILAERGTARAQALQRLARMPVHARRLKLALVRWVPTVALGSVVALGAIESELHPLPPGPPAAAAVRAPVAAQRTPAAASPLTATLAANTARAAAVSASVPQLADIDNARVDSWVKKLSTSLKSEFSASLDRMSNVGSMIVDKLEARDMPNNLVYLAMIESELKPTARSKVNAVGLWQFMSGTARQYGLTVSGKTDQRKDPAKETDAALTYLSDLHDRFGSWYLAAAAYNAGPGAVERALKSVTGKTTGTDEDFFKIASKLPKETRDYVPKLIAAARIGSDPGKYGFDTDTTSG